MLIIRNLNHSWPYLVAGWGGGGGDGLLDEKVWMLAVLSRCLNEGVFS